MDIRASAVCARIKRERWHFPSMSAFYDLYNTFSRFRWKNSSENSNLGEVLRILATYWELCEFTEERAAFWMFIVEKHDLYTIHLEDSSPPRHIYSGLRKVKQCYGSIMTNNKLQVWTRYRSVTWFYLFIWFLVCWNDYTRHFLFLSKAQVYKCFLMEYCPWR